MNTHFNEKIYNYVYKITNLINGKFYYGIHSTDNLNDGYFGSGKLLRKSIKKYGKENFIKENIVYYTTRREASDYEKRIVTIDMVQSDMCYNLVTGGDIYDSTIGYKHAQSTKDIISRKNKGKQGSFLGKRHKESSKKLMSEASKRQTKVKGRICSDDTKNKISQANKGKLSGDKNPTYGTHRSDVTKLKISLKNAGRKWTDDMKFKLKDRFGKRVVQMTMGGIIIAIHNSIASAGKSINDNNFATAANKISKCCNNKKKSYMQCLWMFEI